jgi:hypothetical protein
VIIKSYSLDNNKMIIELICKNGISTILNLEYLKVCYVRGNRINFKNMTSPLEKDKNNGWLKYKLIYYENIDRILENYLRNNSFFIGTWRSGLVNKIIVLEKAKKIGFKIPESILCTNLNSIKAGQIGLGI